MPKGENMLARTDYKFWCYLMAVLALAYGCEPTDDDDDSASSNVDDSADDDSATTDDDSASMDDDDSSAADDDDLAPLDEDGDGWSDDLDCDDSDPAVNPDANEINCDGIDNDCDGALDPDNIDNDGDGEDECTGDCDDNDPSINSTAVELCDDQDGNCNGVDDEPYQTYWFDSDGDYWGTTMSQQACDPVYPFVGTQTGDCDDNNATRFPGNTEICDDIDNDCDYSLSVEELDDDGDGLTECAGDCDDQDDQNFPGNLETCDRQDNDCDGVTPSDEVDGDSDGQTECEGDCDDLDDQNFIGNSEVCDEQDNDCDGVVPSDEIDDDFDGQIECAGDCDDQDDQNFTGNPEICDRQDNDCDGVTPSDEVDDDADGLTDCEGDCDDLDPDNFPGNPETCDGQDNDCDGTPSGDEIDDDFDGQTECAGDCDDLDPDNFSGNLPQFDGQDNDCDGDVDRYGLDIADSILTGEAWGARTGRSVASAGDVNGDGYDDVLVGAPFLAQSRGAVYLLLGSASGISSMDLTSADTILTGQQSYDEAGYSVSSAGDINGDGYDDIIIGASNNSSVLSNAGAVYLVLGSSTGIPSMNLTVADAKLTGELDGDLSGASVASAGDVNGDGYSDILIGAPGNDSGGTSNGGTYVVLGSAAGIQSMSLSAADTKLSGEIPYEASGTSVATAGDVNGDGYDDILVGVPLHDSGGNDTGAAYLFLGSPTGIPSVSLSYAAAKFTGEAQDNAAGRSVATAGDVNGDGYSDVIIGAPEHDSPQVNMGATYLIYGSSVGIPTMNLADADAKLIGEAMNDEAGYSAKSAGDVNGDGLDDIIIGAHGNQFMGSAYVVLGSASGIQSMGLSTANAKFTGVASGAGFSVASAGDVNNDGFSDVLVGAPWWNNSTVGMCFVIESAF